MRISDWSSDVCSSDLSWSGFARAQERHVGTYSEIIVTGEKARRSLQDTPSSVAVTTARRIEEENLLSLQEVYARTANVTETFSAGGFTIRGIADRGIMGGEGAARSEEHTSELQSLMR